MKKRLIFLFMMILAVALLCSCDSTKDPSSTSTQAQGSAEQDMAGILEIPTEYDFGGYEVKILVSGNYKNNDFDGDETSDGVVEKAQYKRNLEVETQYKVKLAVDYKASHGTEPNGGGTGYNAFSKMYASESYDYDFATIGSYNAGACAYNSFLSDLNAMPNIDLSKDWWDQSANRQFEIRGKMFFATGDFTLAENRMAHLIVFNKTLLKEKNLESPYELVRAGKWTWDAFASQVKAVHEDLGGDGMNEKDIYGCLTWKDAYSAAVASIGTQIARVDEEGNLKLSLYTTKTVDIVDKYSQMIFDTETCFDYQYGYGSSDWDKIRWGMFSEGRALYALQTAAYPGQMRTYDVDFGILPYPKHSEDQVNHYSLVSAYHNQYVVVPYYVEDAERTGMLIEIIAYKGMEAVTPAFYEKQLIGRDSRDDESEEMLDVVYSNVIYDPGLVYRITGMADTYYQVRAQRNNVFASAYQASLNTAQKDIESINQLFSDFS